MKNYRRFHTFHNKLITFSKVKLSATLLSFVLPKEALIFSAVSPQRPYEYYREKGTVKLFELIGQKRKRLGKFVCGGKPKKYEMRLLLWMVMYLMNSTDKVMGNNEVNNKVTFCNTDGFQIVLNQ